MKKVIYLIALLAPLLLIHCKKDTVSEESRLDLLTGRKWKIDKLLYSVKGDPTSLDFTNGVYKSCELDDVYEFKKDHTFTRTDGSNVCGSIALYGPFGNAGWSADSTLTQLNVELFAVYLYKFKVLNINSTELQLQRSTVDYLQQEALYTFYFKKIN